MTFLKVSVYYNIGHEDLVVEALRYQLSNPNFQIRRRVIELVYQIKTESAKKVMFEAINDESHIIREKAIEYLGNLKYTEAVPSLIRILEKKRRKGVYSRNYL